MERSCGGSPASRIGLALSPPSDLTYIDGPLHRFSILARIRQAFGDQEGTLAALQLAVQAYGSPNGNCA